MHSVSCHLPPKEMDENHVVLVYESPKVLYFRTNGLDFHFETFPQGTKRNVLQSQHFK